MTNVLAALLILNVHTQQMVETNAVRITCAEAGCTNQMEYNVIVVDTPGHTCSFHQTYQNWRRLVEPNDNYFHWTPPVTNDWKIICECKPEKSHQETHKGCQYIHTRPFVWTNATCTTTVLGTEGNPMFDIVQIESHDSPTNEMAFVPNVFYTGGVYLRAHKKPSK